MASGGTVGAAEGMAVLALVCTGIPVGRVGVGRHIR